jgi:hypothetical protein
VLRLPSTAAVAGFGTEYKCAARHPSLRPLGAVAIV